MTNSTTIAQEEIFGPEGCVIPFGDEDEAVAHRQPHAGRSFCTGRDLREFQRLQTTTVEDSELRESGRFLYGPLEDFEKPVIAKINGFALTGGCEFAAACDFRIASERATCALTEMDLAVFPGRARPTCGRASSARAARSR